MSIEAYIENKREIQASILNYIDSEDDNFQHLRQILNDQNIRADANDLKDFIILLNIITNNHHRSTNFFTKIENILHFFSDDITNKFSNSEIYQIFKNNKRILLYLLQENIVTLDKQIILDMHKNEYYCEYFSPEIKTFIDNQENSDELHFPTELIQKISITVPTDFNDKRKNGENDSYICNLIRNDSIDDFIVYINRNNISVNSIIAPSIFETNKFLLENRPSLIEYSTFYGSIQIFQYLQLNNADLPSELWQYTIHGKNAEIIHHLENYHIQPPNDSYTTCLNESILCHHNNIANYIKETLMQTNEEEENDNQSDNELTELSYIIKYHNYEFFPNDFINTKFVLYYLIRYHYSKLLDLFLNSKNLQIIIPNLDNYIQLDSKYMTVFGSSSLVQNRLTNQKFILEESSDQFKNEDFNEFDILIQTQYPSLIKAKGLNVIEDKRNNEHTTVFLYDYYENGSLSKYIEQKSKGIISTEINTNDYILILGISIGLKYLHDHDIIPVSFIPGSILIDDNFYPIISNFELSKKKLDQYLFRELENSKERVFYTPPEVFAGYEFIKSSNIYSLSFMIYQILTGKVLFRIDRRRDSKYNIMRNICNGCRPDISLIQNEDIAGFLERCWHDNPDERLTIDEIIDFITGPVFCSYFNSLDHESIKRYLDIYGDEFNNLKERF